MFAAIETCALTKYFPVQQGWRGLFSAHQAPRPAVDHINLSIAPGEFFGLVGPNGAGKTTLIKMLATLIAPTFGTAIINGFPLNQQVGVKSSIGLVTGDERSFYWRLTGRQNLQFFAALHGLANDQIDARIEQVVAQMNLESVIDARFQTYSSGMRQRLAIARALLHNPPILILDEPAKGLDPQATHLLYQLIQGKLSQEQGITILLTTHSMEDVEKLCNRVAVMYQGSIRACGTINELRRETGLNERFSVQIRHNNPALLKRLQDQVSHFEIHSLQAGKIRLEFDIPQQEGDLHQVLETIWQSGGTILDFDRQTKSFEAVFEQLTQPNGGKTHAVSHPPSLPPPPSPPAATLPRRRLRPGALWQIAFAFFRRDVTEEISYRFSFLLQFLNLFLSIGVFYFIAQLLGPAATPYLQPYGGDYLAFVIIGLAFSGYFGVGLSSFSSSLRQAQTTGTLEAMLATPTPLPVIILASSLWNYALTTLKVLLYLGMGVGLLGAPLGKGNYLAAVLILALAILTFSGIGILAASFTMVLKRGDPIAWMMSYLAALLGGVYYPISILPPWLQTLARLIPVTYALEAMRKALILGAPLVEMKIELIALGLFSLFLLPLSLVAFRYAVHRARLDGSLTHY